MHRILFVIILSTALCFVAWAQQKVPPQPTAAKPAKVAEGRMGPQNLFYIGTSRLNSSVDEELSFSGFGVNFGLQLGRGISENLVPYFLLEYAFAPNVQYIGDRKGHLHDLFAGGGLNYYFNKDFFLSANLNYGIINLQRLATSTSDEGTAFVTKPGIGGSIAFGGDRKINNNLWLSASLVFKVRTGQIDEYDNNTFTTSIMGMRNQNTYLGANLGLKFKKNAN